MFMASAIIDSAESYLPQIGGETSDTLSVARSRFLIPLTATSSDALDKQIQNLAAWDLHRINVVDLAHTLGTCAPVGQESMKEDLDPARFIETGTGSFSKFPIASVFTGQGAQ